MNSAAAGKEGQGTHTAAPVYIAFCCSPSLYLRAPRPRANLFLLAVELGLAQRAFGVAQASVLGPCRSQPFLRTGYRCPGLRSWESVSAQNQSSRHGPPSGGPDFQRPSNRAPATRVGVSKSLLGRCLCGFEASRTRRASTTSARRDSARPGVVSCSRFSSGATRNGEMRRQIGW